MTKQKCIAVLIGGLMLTSMVSCGPGAPSAPGNSGIIPPTLAQATKPATVTEPTEPQRGTSIPISPTQVITDKKATSEPQLGTVIPISPSQVITENKAMSGPQVQPRLGDESSESVKLAKQDLAQRLGVSVESITVGAVISQEFSVDAFNCRTSKERIARDESPAVILGQTILLSVSGRRYEYHASGQTVIFCRPLL